jgi:hypothetical protein
MLHQSGHSGQFIAMLMQPVKATEGVQRFGWLVEGRAAFPTPGDRRCLASNAGSSFAVTATAFAGTRQVRFADFSVHFCHCSLYIEEHL